jgi:hypothetical protein
MLVHQRVSIFPVVACKNFLTMVQELDIKPAPFDHVSDIEPAFFGSHFDLYIYITIYIYIHTLFTHVWIHIGFDYEIYNATSIQWYITYGSYPSINSLHESQPLTNSLNKNSEQPNSVNKQPQPLSSQQSQQPPATAKNSTWWFIPLSKWVITPNISVD